jgi:hypothetical protein
LETLSPSGNAHSESIPLLLDELTQIVEIKELRIKSALDSMDHLADIVENLDRSLVRKEEAEALRERITAMQKAATAARNLLSQEYSGSLPPDWHQLTNNALEQYLTSMKLVADCYFHRIPSTQNYYDTLTFEKNALPQIINRIDWTRASKNKEFAAGRPVSHDNRIIKVSHEGEINFDPYAGEVWIAWNRGVAGIVRDLLQNAVYATKQIPDPWDSRPGILAHLWVRVKYGMESVPSLTDTSRRDIQT